MFTHIRAIVPAALRELIEQLEVFRPDDPGLDLTAIRDGNPLTAESGAVEQLAEDVARLGGADGARDGGHG